MRSLAYGFLWVVSRTFYAFLIGMLTVFVVAGVGLAIMFLFSLLGVSTETILAVRDWLLFDLGEALGWGWLIPIGFLYFAADNACKNRGM